MIIKYYDKEFLVYNEIDLKKIFSKVFNYLIYSENIL